MASSLVWADYLAVVIYVLLVLIVGYWAAYKANTDNATGYFLAGRRTNWLLVGASTWATNIGAPMFIGIAGSAAASGLAIVMFEWTAMFALIALGWLFLPVYMSSGCYTMPEYLKLRYGGQRIRMWFSVVQIFITIISQIAGQMYAGALFIQEIFKWNIYTSVILILALTALCTILGGLKAVIWTDALQTVVLVVGCTMVAVMSMIKIGGYEALKKQYMAASSNETILADNNNTLNSTRECGVPNPRSFHVFRSAAAGDYPWPGMIGGLAILGLSAWCTDQICVQRSLSAKNISHAKAGVLMAAYLKILPFIFFVIPGMISRALYPGEVACSDPDTCTKICENPTGCSDLAYPLLVIRVMPHGARGLMLAALLAALMSSLTSIFNSATTVFTMDIWRRIRKHASEGELMVVSRVFALLLVGLAILWLPILQMVKGSQFWDYSQSIASYLLPPIVVVFLLGIFWTRTTEIGAFSGLVVGFVVGVIRMCLAWSHSPTLCGSGQPDTQYAVVKKVHYLHFAMILAGVVALVIVVVSWFGKPRSANKLHKVTWWTRHDPQLPDLTDSEDDEKEEEKIEIPTKPVQYKGWRYRLLRFVCGINKQPRRKISKEEKIARQLDISNISENKRLKLFLNINAVVCTAVAIFLHAFWA